MSTQDVPDREVQGLIRRPPAPAEEVAGPALVNMLAETRDAMHAMAALLRDAKKDVTYRFQAIRAAFQCDANGDGAVLLYEVPQGATGSLTWLAVDEPAVTPSNPDTSANLYHGIYAGPGGQLTQPQVIAAGNLLACQPNAPSPDAQIPYTYIFGDQKASPRLRGPEAFWFAVDAATASRQVILRGIVCIEQPGA